MTHEFLAPESPSGHSAQDRPVREGGGGGIRVNQWKRATRRRPWGYLREEECEVTMSGQGHLQAAEFFLIHLPLLTLFS